MSFLIFSPSYVYHCPSGYYFRLRIPQDLKHLVGKAEFRYSLATGIRKIAKLRAREIVHFIQKLFTEVRRKMSEFTTAKINQLVRNYIKTTLKNDEKCRALNVYDLEDKTFLEGSNMGKAEAENILSYVDKELKHGALVKVKHVGQSVDNNDLMAPVLKALLEQEGKEVNRDSVDYKLLNRSLLKAFQSILKVRAKRSEGDYAESDEELIPELKEEDNVKGVSVSHSPVPTSVEEQAQTTFSEMKERYKTESSTAREWSQGTLKEYNETYDLFIELMGDLALKDITRPLMSNFQGTLLKLPVNRKKLKEFRDKTVDELLSLELPSEKLMQPTTVNKHLQRISSVLDYAVVHGEILLNPAKDMKIRVRRKAQEVRDTFTSEDLKALFGSEKFVKDGKKSPWKYWLPIIGLYTGCRIEEICQLHLGDIKQEDEVWFFDINAEGIKSTKTLSSIRKVPVHDRLIELGFIDHVEALRGRGEQRLFPELKNTQGGKFSHYPTRWFGTFKKSCGITGDSKVFHSFRHTFITAMKHSGVDMPIMHELDGHSMQSETMKTYGKGYPVKVL